MYSLSVVNVIGHCLQKAWASSPFYGGDTAEKSRKWGDRVNVECECGAEYEVGADNSIAGWDVNFEGEKLPKTFKYKEYVSGEPDEGT